MMTRRSLILAFIGMVVAGLSAFMPMRLILPDDQLSVRTVSGTIWSAQLEGVAFEGLPLGDLDAKYVWPGGWQFTDGGGISGFVGGKKGAYSIRRLNGTLPLSLANPAAQDVEFRDVDLAFGRGGCVEAKGRIRLRLAASIAGVPMGQTLVGAPRCTGEVLTARLASQSGLEVLTVSAQPDGRTVTELLIRPGDRDAGAALLAAGFAQVPMGYRMVLVD